MTLQTFWPNICCYLEVYDLYTTVSRVNKYLCKLLRHDATFYKQHYHKQQKIQSQSHFFQNYALCSTNQWVRFIGPTKERANFDYLRRSTKFGKLNPNLVQVVQEQQTMLHVFFNMPSEEAMLEQAVQVLLQVHDVRPISRFACAIMVNDVEFALFIDKLDKRPLVCTMDEWSNLDELDIWLNKQVDLVKVSLKSNDFVYCQLLEMLNLEAEQEPNDKLPLLAFLSLACKAVLTPYQNYAATSLLRDFTKHLDPEEPRSIWFEDVESILKHRSKLKIFKSIMSEPIMHPAVLNMLLITRIDEAHVVEAFLHAAASNQAKVLHAIYVHRFKRIAPVLGHAFQIAAKREHEAAVKTLLNILVEQEMLNVLPKSALYDMENPTMANFTIACMLSDPSSKSIVKELAEHVDEKTGMTVFHKYVMLGVDKMTMDYLVRTGAPHDLYMTSTFDTSCSCGDASIWRAKDEASCQSKSDLFALLNKNHCAPIANSCKEAPVSKILLLAFPGCGIANLMSSLLGTIFAWDDYDTNVKHVDIPNLKLHIVIQNAYNFDPCSQAHHTMVDTILAHSKDALLVLCYGIHQQQSTKLFHLAEVLKKWRQRIVLLGLVQGKRKVLASFAHQFAQRVGIHFVELATTEQQQVQQCWNNLVQYEYTYEKYVEFLAIIYF